MLENEDVILPDDFEMDSPQSEEVTETPVNEEVDTTETEQTEGTEEAIQALKVKYNKEEMEIPLEEAIPLVQKGLNYDKTLERLQALESDPRLKFVEELAQEQGMDVNDYLEAIKQHREQQKLDELIQQNIPEDMAREIMENRKFREQIESERKTKQEDEKKNQEFMDFLEYFKQSNDRDFDPAKDQIPPEVWELTQKGVPIKYAFMEHHTSQLKEQMKVFKQNAENQQKAPISGVTAHGGDEPASEDPFLQGFNSI